MGKYRILDTNLWGLKVIHFDISKDSAYLGPVLYIRSGFIR